MDALEPEAVRELRNKSSKVILDVLVDEADREMRNICSIIGAMIDEEIAGTDMRTKAVLVL